MSRPRTLVAVGALGVVLAGCTASPRGGGPASAPATLPAASSTSPTRTAAPSAAATATPAVGCPDRYAPPDPDRPVLTLGLYFGPGNRSVTGTATVRFRPDLPIRDVVLRLWPNAPRAARGGARLTPERVRVSGPDGLQTFRHRVEPAGAPAGRPGTLLRVPLDREVPAGTEVTASVAYTLDLPADVNDRVGHDGGTAWLASAHPMLAWERGRGWATEPATAAFAETSTSEVFRLDRLDVAVAPGETVLATGTRAGTRRRGDRVVHTFRADAVRDVMVAVSRFRTATVAGPGGLPVRVGVAPGLPDDPTQIARLTATAVRVHAARFGPFPYPTLDVAVVPDVRGGIEYPAAFLLGTRQTDATLTHEVAHEWFYGLVGDNQGRDPWLDEAFATYAEALHRGTGPVYRRRTIPAYGRNRVGRPMRYWERDAATYFRSVYVQGAVMLLEARAAAGPARFDHAIRCYVAANAHRIATPADLERALAGLPAAIRVLRRYGALAAR